MVLSHYKTFMTILTLLGMVASLNWSTVAQAGTGGECITCPLRLRVHGRVPGGKFIGSLTIGDLTFKDGQLLASGALAGVVTVQGVTQEIGGLGEPATFTGVVMGLLQAGQGNVCNLMLDFSPIHLYDFVIDLAPIILIVHQHGVLPVLLLFCELADLLDSSPLNLSEIQQVLDEINYLLPDENIIILP